MHTLHEVVHHLGDIRRQLGDSTKCTYLRSVLIWIHSVTPRIVVSDVEGQVQFLREVFGSTREPVAVGPLRFVSGIHW